jgi:DNA-binding CsgD family transcriptional regulator
MSTWSLIVRGIIGLAVAFWFFNLVAVAAFAVPDRYTGAESIVISILVLIGGSLPIAVLWYLFRDTLSVGQRAAPQEALRRPSQPVGPATYSLIDPISDRELEVLSLIGRGLSNKEIAGHLTVSVATVKTHTNNINRKLGTRTRKQALARARELDLL